MATRRWVTSDAYDAAIQIVIAARHSQKLSQRGLADRLGKPRSFVSKLENKERRLDIVEFVMLARALRLSPSEWMDQVSNSLPVEIDM